MYFEENHYIYPQEKIKQWQTKLKGKFHKLSFSYRRSFQEVEELPKIYDALEIKNQTEKLLY